MTNSMGVSSGGDGLLHTGELRPNTTDQQLKQAMRHNGLSELVVQTEDQRILLYAEKLKFSGACQTMPKVGQQVTLFVPGKSEPISGTVIAADEEASRSEKIATRTGLFTAAGTVSLGMAGALWGQAAPTRMIGKLVAGMVMKSAGGPMSGAIAGTVPAPYDYGLQLLVAPSFQPRKWQRTPPGPLNGAVGPLGLPLPD